MLDGKISGLYIFGLELYPQSTVDHKRSTYFFGQTLRGEKQFGIIGNTKGFSGEAQPSRDKKNVLICPLTPENAAALRARLPWLRPQPLGLARSVGCGDRLGLATPGHLRAVRRVGGFAPILAQQSMRENARTGRSPQEVMDDAMWGVFEAGWRDPWGADADHLKTPADIDLCVAAGYTFYTIDPGDHVDNDAHTAPVAALRDKLLLLPWEGLEDTADAQRARYLDGPILIGEEALTFDEEAWLRAACKYGKAIAHTAMMYRHLARAAGNRPFELEVSVDETETPTSPLEHVFVASELKRLGVQWVSLAPRYLGRFEKGVDFIGDLAAFEADFAQHAAIARALGPYKLSLHSGSDKFSIYPVIARHVGELVHVKTAGTSYLEALRALARTEPALFRDILALSQARFETDKASYHISADPAQVPAADALADDELPGLLDQFDARQLLHVTFGSVLQQFSPALHDALKAQEAGHYQALETHFVRHLEPFVQT